MGDGDRTDARPEDGQGRFGERRDAAREAIAERRDAARERLAETREAIADRRDAALGAAAENLASARAAAGERMAEARDAAADAIARVKPRLRGVSHEWAFFSSLGFGVLLIVLAEGGRATLAAAIYAVSLSGLFGVSALYHRIEWRRPETRRLMRRLDHTMIFLLIAGTVTPFALLVLEPPLATALLVAVWCGALAGALVELVWTDSPKWVSAAVYVAVGLIGAIGFPAIVAEAGLGAGILIAFGGALYVAGAIIYAAQRPDPRPSVFGYHEIFHVLVIAAAAAHFAAVALFAVPAG